MPARTASAKSTPVKREATSPTNVTPSPTKRRRGVAVKKEDQDDQDVQPPSTPPRVKKEEDESALPSPEKTPKSKQSTSERKLAAYNSSKSKEPFPDLALPTYEEAERVAWILGEFHGYKREQDGGRGLPQYSTPKGENKWGGCGDVASVLEAVIRTVLSCNTSNRNSAAAHKSLTERFGRQNWQAIHEQPESELVEAIRCGGLANNKAKTIKGILRETEARHGKLSLDHLHNATDDEIMQELVSFNGVGPKVASCVLAFCIGRQSMAVDTHVFRLCKALGWVPEKANRDQTYYHLHERVPGHLKYPLHVLLIKHGKLCPSCSAKGFATVGNDTMSGPSGEESEGEPRPCPLRANGLIGRKGKALKDAAAKGHVKREEGDDPAVKSEVKDEPDVDPHRAALLAAQGLSASDLIKALQRARSTDAQDIITPELKEKGYSLELHHALELSTADQKKVFAIFEQNMKTMYKNSSLGWKPAAKKKDLFHKESRFAIVRADDDIAGYAMFRLDTEPCHPTKDPVVSTRNGADKEEVEVAYIYELQISKDHQRQGLGHELADVVSSLATQLEIPKVMLTVFSANDAARAFYTAEGYRPDPNCPTQLPEGEKHAVDYEILYKLTSAAQT